MDSVLEQFDLRPCRDTIVVTGIGSNNCVYHAVIGFHTRNYFTIVPENCIHATHPEGQSFALSQFRSHAYNFNIKVVRSEYIHLSQEESGLKIASAAR
jgi:nicotinamidase-related amidase